MKKLQSWLFRTTEPYNIFKYKNINLTFNYQFELKYHNIKDAIGMPINQEIQYFSRIKNY